MEEEEEEDLSDLVWPDDDEVQIIEGPPPSPVPVVDLEPQQKNTEVINVSDDEDDWPGSSCSSRCSTRCSGCEEENCFVCAQRDI